VFGIALGALEAHTCAICFTIRRIIKKKKKKKHKKLFVSFVGADFCEGTYLRYGFI